jgi:hypothetical protein
MAIEVSVHQLLRLTALENLDYVRLGYRAEDMRFTAHQQNRATLPYQPCEDRAVEVLKQHAEQAWARLPLRHLSINTRTCPERGMLPVEVLPHLAQLSSLTYLACVCRLPEDFPATLQQLQGSQELQLSVTAQDGKVTWASAAGAAAARLRVQQLMHGCAVAALDQPVFG